MDLNRVEDFHPLIPHEEIPLEETINPARQHLIDSTLPIKRFAQIAIRDIGDVWKKLIANPTPLQFGISVLRLIRGAVTGSILLTATLVHTVSHLIGLSQLLLKVDLVFSNFIANTTSSKIRYVLTALRIFTFIPAVLVNFDHLGKALLFASGVSHWDIMRANTGKVKYLGDELPKKEALTKSFNTKLELMEGDGILKQKEDLKIEFGKDSDGKSLYLDGKFLMPTKEPVKGIIILQHGNGGCYETDGHLAEKYLTKGYAVCLYNRRGCVNSEGQPSQMGAVDDCERVVKLMQEKAGVLMPENSSVNRFIKIHGHSMGGLIAAKASGREALEGVQVILDRTGINLQSVGFEWTKGVTSFATDLLNITSGSEFENQQEIDVLSKRGDLIVIKSAKKERNSSSLDFKDEVFGRGEVALHGKPNQQLNALQNELVRLENEVASKEKELNQKIEEWKKGSLEKVQNMDQENLRPHLIAMGKKVKSLELASHMTVLSGSKKFKRTELNKLFEARSKIDFEKEFFGIGETNYKILLALTKTSLPERISKISLNDKHNDVIDDALKSDPQLGYSKVREILRDVESLKAKLVKFNSEIAPHFQKDQDTKVLINVGEGDAHNANLTDDVLDGIDLMLSHKQE